MAAHYEYDAWGNVVSVKDNSGYTITSKTSFANINPIRYRGYYYDTETGFYYLKSRYYDPANCRFISADTQIDLEHGTTNLNLFSYCGNDPVNRVDPNGNFWPGAAIEIGKLGASLIAAIAAVKIAEGASKAIDEAESLPLPEIPFLLKRRKAIVKAETKEREREKEAVSNPDTPIYIYRYGGTNPGNLKPKKRDVDLYPSTHKGLSFSTVPRPGSARTTIEAINSTGVLYAVKDGDNHVSVHPIGGTLEDWYNAGASSIWTKALKSVVVKW